MVAIWLYEWDGRIGGLPWSSGRVIAGFRTQSQANRVRYHSVQVHGQSRARKLLILLTCRCKMYPLTFKLLFARPWKLQEERPQQRREPTIDAQRIE